MKAAAKELAFEVAKGAACEGGKAAFNAAVVQPLRLVGSAAEAGCQLTPLGLFNMGLGIVNLAVGATSLGVGAFNAYQVVKVRNELGVLQLQTASIGVKTQEALADIAMSVGPDLSADVRRLSSQLGALVVGGNRTRIALYEMKEQLNVRLDRVNLVMGWVGKLVTVLAEKQGSLLQQLAELQEDVRRGFEGLHILHKSAEQEEFQASIALVADLSRDVLSELEAGEASTQECHELRMAAKKLAAWTAPRLGRYAPGDLRRAPLIVARVYALVTEVDARVLGEVLTQRAQGAKSAGGAGTGQSPLTHTCVQKLVTLAREVEAEAHALIETRATSPYALAMDVAPILSQYALLHRSIEAKLGVGLPVVFEVQEASLVGGEPQLAVSWDDGLAAMRVLCAMVASDAGDGGDSEWLEMETVEDVVWLAQVLERAPRECRLKDMQRISKRVLLNALGVPGALGSGRRLDCTGLAALKVLARPQLREAVEAAVNGCFGSLAGPLVMPAWTSVAKSVQEELARLANANATLAKVEESELSEAQEELYRVRAELQTVVRKLQARTCHVLEGHTNKVTGVAWRPDGQLLASSSDDKTVALWDTELWRQVQVLKGHSNRVRGLAWSPDGRHLVSASDDKTTVVWDTTTGDPVRTLGGHGDQIRAVSWSPDGRTLATASDDKTAMLWSAETGQRLHVLSGHMDFIRCVAWGPDANQLGTGSSDGMALVWDARTASRVQLLKGHAGPIYGLAWRPDGNLIATASWDYTIKLWEVGSGQPLSTLNGHTDYVMGVTWSPDGQKLATVSDDKMVMLWDPILEENTRVLEGHSDYIRGVAWSPNGSTLATASFDETVGLWAVE